MNGYLVFIYSTDKIRTNLERMIVMDKVTDGFKMFMKETDGIGEAFMGAIFKLSENSALDKKMHELAYISVLVSTKMYDGLPFHMKQAKEYGASMEEIKSAILVPLPIMGIQVADALPYLNDLIEK